MNDPDRWHISDDFDSDAIFADIVAHLNDDVTEAEPTQRPPVKDGATDLEATEKARDDKAREDKAGDDKAGDDKAPGDSLADEEPRPTNHLPALPTPGDPQVIPPPQVWRADEVDDEEEEHFEPPPMAPLPVGDLQFWAIIAGMSGGPLLLLYLVYFNPNASSYWILAAIAMSLGGFALLVSRLPSHHEDDDDGARL